ncbi:hypothetical protein OE09_1654 [Flavobacteriaceae bacterium MAR_2010_72]|nr:hypothetical protein OE09_1654 [Flavobacteriaceae bacterium MAR_2010_72]TVZ59626.1 hypothetical protein NA63_2161 [Flavobacteriaceae bacterium MAR_2010_105]
MKFTVVLILVLTLCSCFQNSRNCQDYKTGTFKFDYTINGVEKTGTFIRTDSYSIDYFDNKIDSSSVRWINDCEFVLKKINPKSRADEDAIHMKILSTTDSSYTFEYKLALKKPNQNQIVKKGLAIKIK